MYKKIINKDKDNCFAVNVLYMMFKRGGYGIKRNINIGLYYLIKYNCEYLAHNKTPSYILFP
jgi:hypothetical protein